MEKQELMVKTIIVRGVLFIVFLILIAFFLIGNSQSQDTESNNLEHNESQSLTIKDHIELLDKEEIKTKIKERKQKETKSNYNNFEIHLDKKEIYDKIKEITGWQNDDIIELFVSEAKDRDISIFDEALPIAAVETGETYRFDVVNYNNNGTVDKGLFQINDVTKPYIIDILNYEGIYFDNYSRFNPKFNIIGGLAWIEHLKEEHSLDGHALFSSYNRGIGGANQYYNINNTYKTNYSRNVKEVSKNIY